MKDLQRRQAEQETQTGIGRIFHPPGNGSRMAGSGSARRQNAGGRVKRYSESRGRGGRRWRQNAAAGTVTVNTWQAAQAAQCICRQNGSGGRPVQQQVAQGAEVHVRLWQADGGENVAKRQAHGGEWQAASTQR